MKQIRLKLNKYLDEQQISRYELARRTGIQYPTIDGYYKNAVMRLDLGNMSRILTALDCDLTDIIEVIET